MLTEVRNNVVRIRAQHIGHMGRAGIVLQPGLRLLARVERGNHSSRGIGLEALAIVLELMRPASRPDEPERIEGHAQQRLFLRGLSVLVEPPEALLRFETEESQKHEG